MMVRRLSKWKNDLLIIYLAIKFYRAAMQLVPDIEFRMARKGQSQPPTTTIDLSNQP